jgi:hypothetical protein
MSEVGVVGVGVLPLRTSFPAVLTPLKLNKSLSGGTVNSVPCACEKCSRFLWNSSLVISSGSCVRVLVPSWFVWRM